MKKQVIKGIMLILICSVSTSCISAGAEKNESKDNVVKQKGVECKEGTVNKNEGGVISFEEYRKLFEQLNDSIKVDGYTLKASSLGPDVTAIDKDLSFGKREWITIDGKMNNTEPESTQEMLFFENARGTSQITITVGYTDNYIAEDLLIYPTNRGYDELNRELADKTDSIVVAYKNILISVQHVATEKADMVATQSALREVIKNLKKAPNN
ncbi:hypothetical protein P6P90_04230 [Ectobacillus antri]|uniref:Uncharacterized protein n=1 Tax=Ectobacillus antri TaxID=2486280 RepID=A0ABT6H2I8_9BACI|nr:hypothetical protein [Ectobacillus antri]MDG4655447.1 hypothetical protein [Ectobacillus antri]MDG5753205.1 hypothetical protein [Ectobacillus antri]